MVKRLVQTFVGLLVAGILLWLLFRGTAWDEVEEALRTVQPGWLLLAQGMLWAACFTRVHRWGFVVRASGPASFRSLFSATQIGFLVNFTIPARLGELVRAFLLSRLAGFAFPRAIALVALDRVNDVIGLLAVVLVAAVALAADAGVELPPHAVGNPEAISVSVSLIRAAGWAIGVGVVVALVLLASLYAQRELVIRWTRLALGWLPPALVTRLVAILESFAEGLAVFRSRADLARATFWSLATWLANVVAVAMILEAFSVDYPWHAPFLILAMAAAFIAVPVTPGVVGQFHLPVVVGLLMASPGTAVPMAKAVAIVVHLSVLLPLAALGIYCLFLERVGLLDVVRQTSVTQGAT